eukprot:m.488341 g.488341  ORF g.488341 m.488341 type:complete len:235 (+) comp25724_c0_seq1:34-738(+)
MAAQPTRKLKVLALHGYRQNGLMFREKTGAFRKLVKSLVDFVFVDAPFLAEDQQTPTQDTEPKTVQRGWYFCSGSSYHQATHVEAYERLDETLVFLRTVFAEQGPFDGVFAFSQGASLLSILAAHRKGSGHLRAEDAFDYNFAVYVSGFRSRAEHDADIYTEQITNLPSLHIYGQGDEVVPTERSEQLASQYPGADTIVHAGGHFVPTIKKNTESHTTLVRFLKAQQLAISQAE